ncbi:DUF3857 domain-containing protein [Mucilaginibacter ginsenosidivorans]|uniref:DUF3857 domain-containing protein n=1 Tax=Mucilaginibacter ginsenosidivorans TaxID=398053 RepID=A0A5B8UQN3_9SPHI|nr:DUF3857 domain-containing protein [Mucilaginibacter ginsenosidivorans]QEC61339.1 DUF3857 domain-containing protein [Mucilaginibacter ginsenosidivorans]
MRKYFTLLIFMSVAIGANAQIRLFGIIDSADLRLSSCSFEKDANAEVLFDKARVYFSALGALTMERHKRVKIFNEKGKEYGNVKIEYDNMYGVDNILDIQAETINLENGKIVKDKLDPKLIYAQHTDKNKDAIIISFPNIKPGSVIEYKYTLMRNIASNFPAWHFQTDIPTRYSEFNVLFSSRLQFKAFTRRNQPFAQDTLVTGGHIWTAEDLPSVKDEAYARAEGDGMQSVALLLTSVQTFDGTTIDLSDTWEKAGKKLATAKDYYKELDQHLGGEDTLIKRALALKNDDEKIAYLFNSVKSIMSWNGFQNWASRDGIRNAWKKRVGNSAEVNAVLYHLLKKSGVKAYPMLVSTRENGLIQPDFVDIFQINNLVAYVPVDSNRYYVLDATNKYNVYNQVPYEFLNSYGLCLNRDADKYEMVYMENKTPSKDVIIIVADINPDAKMKGTGQIASYGYRRTQDLELYKTLGDQKFNEYLTGRDNNVKITNLKLSNMQADTLPFEQNFDFSYDLNNSDNYLFFTPNIFTPLHDNPFLSESRTSPIDFGFGSSHVISGRYKLPPGYAVESLPKSVNIVMADKSIKFRRSLENQDGYISLHYEVNIKRTKFLKTEYPDLHEFFKKMYEMLNEQIVLKKK